MVSRFRPRLSRSGARGPLYLRSDLNSSITAKHPGTRANRASPRCKGTSTNGIAVSTSIIPIRSAWTVISPIRSEFVNNGKTPRDPGKSRVAALQGHFDEWYRGFDLDYPDQERVDRYISDPI